MFETVLLLWTRGDFPTVSELITSVSFICRFHRSSSTQ